MFGSYTKYFGHFCSIQPVLSQFKKELMKIFKSKVIFITVSFKKNNILSHKEKSYRPFNFRKTAYSSMRGVKYHDFGEKKFDCFFHGFYTMI